MCSAARSRRSAALLLCIVVAPAAAGPGTTGAEFLTMDPSPRSLALGRASTALAEDSLSALQNPAALAGIDSLELSATQGRPMEGVLHSHLGVALPWQFLKPESQSVQTFSISYRRLSVDPFDAYDRYDNQTGKTSGSDWALQASYARQLSQDVRFPEAGFLDAGFAVKRVQSELDGTVASAIATDVGVLFGWRKPLSILGEQTFGVSVQNMGRGLRFENEITPLPRLLHVAWSPTIIRIPGLRLNAQADQSGASGWNWAGGGEYWLFDVLALRVGWRRSELSDGISFGMGVCLTNRRYLPGRLSFDYAQAKNGAFGIINQFGLSYRFPSRRPPPTQTAQLIEQVEKQIQDQHLFWANETLQRLETLFPTAPEIVQCRAKLNIAASTLTTSKNPYGEGYVGYYASRWAEAASALTAALSMRPEDPEVREFERKAKRNLEEKQSLAEMEGKARISTLYALAEDAAQQGDVVRALRLLDELLGRWNYRPAEQLKRRLLESTPMKPSKHLVAPPVPPQKVINEADITASEDLFYRSMRLYAEGKTDAALASLREASRLDPHNVAVAGAVIRLERELKAKGGR